MEKEVVILDFTGVYLEEKFARHKDFSRLDCSGIEGTEGFCSPEAEAVLAKRISGFTAGGIHFIDNGNYHYVSKLWTDKIKEPFTLVVFDHHADLQPARFGHLLSCGGWIKNVIETNRNIVKACIIGVDRDLIGNSDDDSLDTVAETIPELEEKLAFFWEHQLDAMPDGSRRFPTNLWKDFLEANISGRAYISIDKDVLSPKDAATNWDQGCLRLRDLESMLRAVKRRCRIIGADICGECLATPENVYLNDSVDLDSRANRAIIRVLQER
jgi:arginase family enzyme